VALWSVRTPVRQCFLVGAMANVALDLDWARRGLAGPVVCNANDLAQAAAGAGIHGGTPVGQDPFGACTAALAEDFGDCGHEQAATHSDVFPLSPWRTPGMGTLAHKGCVFPGKRAQTLCEGSARGQDGVGRVGTPGASQADRRVGPFVHAPKKRPQNRNQAHETK
jgi:hypothetical protein